MLKCSACSLEIPENSRFCLTCGTAVPANGTSAATVAATVAMVASLTASNFDEGRFVPGTLLAERYRILGRLGKGGMGEVFRANDLRLGQTVALKFLPEAMASNPGMLARFYNEVRVARQVTHPNVCRVYDIGEVDGQPFISMQFIDGEDLASLLLRIGRLPEDKAVEIARRLCAGLAAAHSQGVLHRDLKPANIMIDGRGQVLITDFGLAGIAEEIRGAEIGSGTPAYMSPEQLAGREVTIKSDIYALGLVLYEMFTGRPAYKAETLAELIRLREESRPAGISSVVRDLDPAIERVILRCLDPEPQNRPASALAVSAALPGGDPLAAALAAGETPSPEMVAAAGTHEALRPAVAIACLLGILISLGTIVFTNSAQMLVNMANLEMPPEALAVESRKIVRQFGYTGAPADRAYGFDYNYDYGEYLRSHNGKHLDWGTLVNGQPSLLTFWYRQSPRPLQPQSVTDLGQVDWNDPPESVSGMAAIELDPQGRMLAFTGVPPQLDESPPRTQQPDAAPLFSAAGLDISRFKTATPQWTPLTATETRAAWTGIVPGKTETPIRIEAAWWRDKPVYFRIVGPWTKPDRMQAASVSTGETVQRYVFLGITLLLIVTGSYLAIRNLRLGRGDKQGAFRLAAFASLVSVVSWLLSAHFGTSTWGLTLFMAALGYALWTGAELWLAYIALEPAVRKRWPRILISWTRVMAGRWKDPLVSRDVLIGLLVGLSYDLVFAVETAVERKTGAAPLTSISLDSLLGFRNALSGALHHVHQSLTGSLEFFLLFFVLLLLVRKEWIAGLLFVLIFALGRGLPSDYPPAMVPAYFIIYGLVVGMLLRFGLLSLVVAIFAADLMSNFVFTWNFSAWYGTASLVVVTLIAGLTIVAFRNSLGGRKVLGDLLE
ncbi:MAG: serine/threonine-protein kinase [Bryobacteraceae bacterium]